MPPSSRRADAERNRDKIVAAARAAFAEADAPVSMAEVSRRAGVGMATLYRNFPGRRELLEALYTDEVDAICAAAHAGTAASPGAALDDWLREFFAFFTSKHLVANDLLAQPDDAVPFLNRSRDRVLAAGAALLDAARASGEVRAELTLEQILELVIAVGSIHGGPEHVEPILRAALDGLRPR